MTVPAPGRLLRAGEEAVAYLADTLGVTRAAAARLHARARARGAVEFVAETRLYTVGKPGGPRSETWQPDSVRYLLARVPDRNLLRLTVLYRDAEPVPEERRHIMPARPFGPDDAPHCRAHPQFRSDCGRCVAERETAGAA